MILIQTEGALLRLEVPVWKLLTQQRYVSKIRSQRLNECLIVAKIKNRKGETRNEENL